MEFIVLYLLIVVLFVFLNIESVKLKIKHFLQMEIFKCTLSKVEILGVLHNLYIYISIGPKYIFHTVAGRFFE